MGRKLCCGFAILKMAPVVRLCPEKDRTTDNSIKVVLMLEQSYEVVYLKAMMLCNSGSSECGRSIFRIW